MPVSLCPLATRYQYIAISKPTSRQLRDCSMLMHMLTMWSRFLPHLAEWLLVWLRSDVSMTCWSWSKSQLVFGLHQLSPSICCSSSVSVCRKERKPSLIYVSLKKQPTFCISPRNMMSVSERTLIFYQNGRSLATFLKGVVYVVKHWKRLLLFLYCIYLLCYKFTSFVNVFPGK